MCYELELVDTKSEVDMSLNEYNALSSRYNVKQNAGWVTYSADPKRINLSGFGTKRIGKLVAGKEFQFTIGSRGIGKKTSLNDTIRTIIASEGLGVIEATSTNSGKAPYPAFNIAGLSEESIGRILDRVEDAIFQIQSNRSA
jgi:hypothetical protein